MFVPVSELVSNITTMGTRCCDCVPGLRIEGETLEVLNQVAVGRLVQN